MGFLWWRFLCLETSTLMQRKSFILVLVYLCITELQKNVHQVVETIETVITEPRYYFLFLIFHKVRHECKAKRAFETREKGTSRKMKANRKKGMQLIVGCHSRDQLLCKFLETFFTCEKRSTRIFFCTPTWPSFHSTFAT